MVVNSRPCWAAQMQQTCPAIPLPHQTQVYGWAKVASALPGRDAVGLPGVQQAGAAQLPLDAQLHLWVRRHVEPVE